jgi:protein ImuB
MPVVCALLPRFRLAAALADPSSDGSLLSGAPSHPARPAALAPEPGAAQLIGEVSLPAERFGLREGMRIGEALSLCPELILVPQDPERADRGWEEALQRLEGIGAEVESDRAGEAFFDAVGLEGLWGGMNGVLDRARGELGSSVRLGIAPGRFCSYVAASRGRPGARPVTISDGSARRFLAPLPVPLLCGRLGASRAGRMSRAADEDAEAEDLPNELERLGITTLGRLAGLSRDAVADRFGRLGLHAQRLARGVDEPLRPRRAREAIAVELELPEAVSGQQLDRALELLIARLLAHRGRRGRTVRALRLSARLAAGGGWRREVALRRAGADRARLADALMPQLALLPAPAATLRLEAVALGPVAGEQLTLSGPEEERRQRISEAVRQTRSAAGSDAVLRVLPVDPDSRIPERREVLMPFPDEG